MINGIIVGIMVAIFIYGIFIFLSLRNFNYLFLSLIAVAQLFEHLSISGFGFQYLWPGNPALGFHVLNVTLILTCMIILLFFRAFLEISTYTPGVDRILKVMIGLFFAILCCYLIFSHIRFRIAVLSLVLFLMQFYYLPLFVPAVKAVKRKDRTGIFVIIGLVILLGSQVEWFLSTFNIIPYNLIHFIQVKGIALLMVMTLGLAVKIKRMRVSLEDLNTGLEKKVLKRTRELRQKSVELKQANDRLQELDHLKTKFFTNISHELRTPLTLISAPVKSFIKGDYGRLTKRNTEILKMVEKNTHRLTKLINDLLDYSKIEAGKMDLKKETCDISSFAAYCLSCVEPAAESMDIHVELEDRTPGIHIPIDRELMEKAMFNLLQNAVKFNRPGGLIHLLLEAGEEEYRIVITDTGIGIPADKIHLIFERFSQVDSSLAKKYEGTGIGLSLTKEVVEMHGGKIKVESTEGQGTTFCLTLPMEGIVVHGNNEKEPVRARSSDKATLVIAEDNGDLRKYLEGMLKKTYHVLLCKNGRTALEKISHTPVDLVIADIMMPEMDGLELLRAIRSGENNRTLPVLLLTARSGIRDKVEGLETGANDYITKPFHPDELLARVKAHLRLNDLRAKLQLNDRSKKSVTEKTKARIEIIKQFIREKYDQNFSMKDLGLAAGMSPGHLGRMFKQDTGEKISDYTSRIRIEKACEMVVQTDKKIIDIAFSVGFESLRTFNMAFSDIRGCSPTQYRRKYSHE